MSEIEASPETIVWLRGMAGSGKSRLIDAYRSTPAASEALILDLDASDDDALTPLTATQRDNPQQRVVVASRASSAVEQALLRHVAYGQVRVFGDADLFYRREEIPGGDDVAARIFADTGGWPLLVHAAMEGRGEVLRPILPDFLDQQALPSMSHGLVVALFAAIDAPLSIAAANDLLGAMEQVPPLLTSAGDALVVASRWCADALATLKTRPTIWRRATTDTAVRLYIRHGHHALAILALNGLGQTVQAHDVYEAAGGALFATQNQASRLRDLLDSFPAGLDQQRDSLLLGRVWQSLLQGRPAAALARLDSRFPGLPTDLRHLRYSHRPVAILFRLLVEADLIGDLSCDVIESWTLLEQLLPAEDGTGRTMLAICTAQALSQAGSDVAAARHLETWRGTRERMTDDAATQRATLLSAHLAFRLGRLNEADARLPDLAGNPSVAAIRMLLAADRGEDHDPSIGIEEVMVEAGWPTLSLDLLREGCFVTFHRSGLAAALDRLGDLASLVRRRHCGIDEQSILIVKIRLYQMARRQAEAASLLTGTSMPRPSVEVALCHIRSRLLARHLDLAQVETGLAGIAGMVLNARERTSFLLLQAGCSWIAGRRADARRMLLLALRDAQSDRAVAWFRPEEEILEPVLDDIFEHRHGVPDTMLPFAGMVADHLRKDRAWGPAVPDNAGLSRQEFRVLDHLAEGRSNKEIARALEISEATVKFHLQGLFAKFEVRNRIALIDAARLRKVIR